MLSNKVEELAESARYDVCMASCSSGASGRPGRMRKPENPLREWIYPASVPGQGKVHILKILQSNHCRNNCSYCKFASSNDSGRRVSLSPDELAKAFITMVHDRLVEGLFLSSGVCGTPSHAMEQMLKTADILRGRFRFNGYIHLKIIPGCDEHMIEHAAAPADRLSINMEAPSQARLSLIAPEKNLNSHILPAASRAAGLLNSRKTGRAPGRIRATSQTTQYVVGAAGESDIDIMNSVDMLYRDYFMFRAYFSAYQKEYNPAAAHSAENYRDKPETGFAGSPLLREHRLYQCDFLLRAYGFRFPDLVFDPDGNIPLETDPKTAWAALNPDLFPVEINSADIMTLLRVPGIGPTAAERIVRSRRKSRIKTIEELKGSGAWTKRAAGWIELDGKTPSAAETSCGGDRRGGSFNPAQKWLFEELAPQGWSTAGEKLRQPGVGYDYPGQRGKWVNYLFSSSDQKIRCR